MADKKQKSSTPASNESTEPQETSHSDATSGRGWHGNPAGHAAAGRKGGQKVSRNKEHMAAIGRKGGEAVSRDRSHMAEIGRKGGQSRTDRSQTQTTS